MALMLLESYCSVGDAGAGPDGLQKTQLHAGPSMQFPWEPPKRMQSFWHFFGLHLSPNLRTVGLHLSLLLLSMDAKPSSAKLRKKTIKTTVVWNSRNNSYTMTMLCNCNRGRDIRDNSTMRARIRRTWVAFILNRLLIIEGYSGS